jgi:hypothetical protein
MYYQRSRRKIARRRMAIILFIAIAVAAALSVYFLFFSEHRINKPVLQDLELKLPDNVISSGSGILYKNQNSLALMDLDGATVWTLPVDSNTTGFVASDNIISTYGQRSAQFFTYDKKQLFTTDLDKDIVSIRCGKNTVGILTTTQDSDGQKHSYIYMYDLSGKNVGEIDLKDRQIIDFGVYGESDMFWTLSLDTSGVVPASYIVTFKKDGTTTNSIEVNTQIVERVDITGDTIYASGTNSLISYTYFGEKKDDTLIYGWQPYDESIDANNIRMLYKTRSSSDEADSISSVKLLDSSLSEIMIYFPREIFTAIINQNGVYAFAKDTIYVYNNSGQVTKTIKLDTPIEAAKKVSNKYAVIWDASSSYIFQLS